MGTPLDLYLRNGTKIRGALVNFVPYVIALQREGVVQVVYKQAILSIVPVAAQDADGPVTTHPRNVIKRRGTGKLRDRLAFEVKNIPPRRR